MNDCCYTWNYVFSVVCNDKQRNFCGRHQGFHEYVNDCSATLKFGQSLVILIQRVNNKEYNQLWANEKSLGYWS